jgi:hypothetical protein
MQLYCITNSTSKPQLSIIVVSASGMGQMLNGF